MPLGHNVHVRKGVAAAVVGLVLAGVIGLVVVPASAGHAPKHVVAASPASTSTTTVPATTTTAVRVTTTTTRVRPPTTRPAPAPPTLTHVALAGCPVPPHAPPPSSPPWHPAVLVPSSQLPAVRAPAPWRANLGAVTGKGMWIWQWSQTDGGNAAAIVAQAVGDGLHQVWIRVADSQQGFYGAPLLDALVPLAHAHGLSVIAWGFPYLYDPMGDAKWTDQVLAWRGPDGQQVDGFSADIEKQTEGVYLTAQRTGVYLQAVRRAAGNRLLVATVYPPLDTYWSTGLYPYATIAHYVDAFAPMIYWECTDPGADATFDVARLAKLRPVDIIGQAYNDAAELGRAVAPSGAEITEFMEAGRKAGAIGASFWVWQSATAQEWAALAAYRWN